MTEDELILSLCKEKDLGKGKSDDERIRQFKEAYKDQADLLAHAAIGDAKALRQLRWILGLKVIT